MTKTIEELAKQFTDELFAGDDLTDFDTQTEKNDAYVTCMAFGNHLMEQPLSVRLTTKEKERVRVLYNEELGMAQHFHKKAKASNDISCRQHYYGLREPYISRMKLLEDIFGKDVFKEGE